MDYNKVLLRIFQVEFRTIFTKERILAPSGLIFAPARVLWFHHLYFSTKRLGYFYEMLSFRVQFSRSLMVIGRRVRVKLFPIYDVAVKFSLGNYFSSNNGGLRFTCQILSKTILKGWHTYTILYVLILKFVKFSDFPFKYDERLLLRAERGIWL